ncbi:MAG: 1-acyl-sn-glycerol-3-phosphate acyltransferase [Bacteroidetes bacterium]|nr:1-acyl-sn-glycerol-3-phosphate acyltransferase [Bacteroidota bacterium]
MQIVKIIFGNLWRWWFFLVGICLFLLWYPVLYILLSNPKYFHIGFRLMRFNANLLFVLSGIRKKISFTVPLDKKKTYVFCINHSSYLDIATSYVAINHYFHIMGKAELTAIPLFNIFFKKMNIPVNRNSMKESHGSYKRANHDLQKNISIVIFPEGTIPVHTPELGNFKNGAFRLALENKVDIVPVIFLDNHQLMPDNRTMRKFGGRPGLCRIHFEAPVSSSHLQNSDVSQLRQHTFNAINKHLTHK